MIRARVRSKRKVVYEPAPSFHSFTVFPEDLNYAGTLFGGKLLAEMDIAAVKAVRRMLYETKCDGAVTASVDRVDFKASAQLGDIIEIISSICRLGNSSIDVALVVNRESETGVVQEICQAKFTFVSLKKGVPYPHQTMMNQHLKN